MVEGKTEEFRVAAILGDEPFDARDEWERFKSMTDAKRYMQLLARLGLGCVLYVLVVEAGVPQLNTLHEITRIEG
jgi:hypothetical protein